MIKKLITLICYNSSTKWLYSNLVFLHFTSAAVIHCKYQTKKIQDKQLANLQRKISDFKILDNPLGFSLERNNNIKREVFFKVEKTFFFISHRFTPSQKVFLHFHKQDYSDLLLNIDLNLFSIFKQQFFLQDCFFAIVSQILTPSASSKCDVICGWTIGHIISLRYCK